MSFWAGSQKEEKRQIHLPAGRWTFFVKNQMNPGIKCRQNVEFERELW